MMENRDESRLIDLNDYDDYDDGGGGEFHS